MIDITNNPAVTLAVEEGVDMAFDEKLAARVRERLSGRAGLVEKRMFGGLAFLLNGNMSIGIHGDELIVRVAPEDTPRVLKQSGVRIFDLTGKPMKGWLLVGGGALKNPASLDTWIDRGVGYAAGLPKK